MKIKVEKSSGNVFADLGFDNSEEMLAKAELTRQINHIIRKKKLSKKQAAAKLKINVSDVTALIYGKFDDFSLERLFRFLNDLGQDVIVKVKPKARTRAKAHLNVTITGQDMNNYAHR